MTSQELLSEMLGFYKYKVDNNLCMPEELEAGVKLLAGDMNTMGSIKDMAHYFGTSEENVRHVINRKVFAKPRRIVLYPFLAILKAVPAKWLKHNKEEE